ncbi:MAG: polyphosphate:AMP phosphotransferase [Planctomycetota bacterium]
MARKRATGEKISKEAYEERESALRTQLLACQGDLMDENYPVLIVLNGLDPEPINEVLNAFFEWFDPRYVEPHALHERTAKERKDLFLRRYWQRIPARGRIAIFAGGWILDAYDELHDGDVSLFQFARNLIHIRKFERQLFEAGAHVIKLWIGEEPRLDPDEPSVQMLQQTDWAAAEWAIVDTQHSRNRKLACGELVAESLRHRLDGERTTLEATPLRDRADIESPPRLADVDLSVSLDREEYRAKRKKLQKKLHKLSDACCKKGIPAVFAFEGWDAGGKGGAIRRITQAVDARNWKVVSVAAPTDGEKAYPYLWRFWRHLPQPGTITMFDRTWYGRVLVERVEGFASDHDWQRAYDEIRDLEEQLVETGAALCKFWLHIDRDEQLARFKAREKIPYKQYKITEEDYRNRDKWDAYVEACDEMFARTSTEAAPWTLVAANDKYNARIIVLKTVCDALERALDR